MQFYLYLVVLLVNRSYRDDSRCNAKYGRYWDQYTQRGSYKIIPGVY